MMACEEYNQRRDGIGMQVVGENIHQDGINYDEYILGCLLICIKFLSLSLCTYIGDDTGYAKGGPASSFTSTPLVLTVYFICRRGDVLFDGAIQMPL